MNERQPRALIGVTGNIATGKSTVARMLGRLEADVIDADKVVHDIMAEHTRVYHEIAETFGSRQSSR